MKILGIESSCDETSAAIVENGTKLLVCTTVSSSKLHRKYGGIVPEVAARKQVEVIIPVLQETMTGVDWSMIDAIAVTVGPGLIGSLLVGVETAKALAFALNKPLIPVNHVLAHPYAVFISDENNQQITTNNLQLSFPAIALVASGGHTELYFMKTIKHLKWLGGTLDDAAGEAFDKTARLIGLGAGGGAAIAASAATNYKIRTANYKLYLPRPMLHSEELNFSFSGLKTAVLREFNKAKAMEQWNNRTVQLFAHEIQESITDVLISKTFKAAQKYQTKSIIVAGGVACNQKLRDKFSALLRHSDPPVGKEESSKEKIQIFFPKIDFCTDSASFISSFAYFHNHPIPWQKIQAEANLTVEVNI